MLPALRPALPVFSGLLSLLALGGGIYNFIEPREGAKAFGLIAQSGSSSHTTAFETAYIRIHGIRNIGNGLVNISLLLYLQFSDLCQTSPIAASTVKKCIGIGLTLGTVVGLGDAWILKQFADSPEVDGDAAKLAAAKSTGHALTSGVILGLGLCWFYV
jgi:hypothetical protein